MPVPIVRVVVEVAAAVRTRRAGSTAAYQRALADDDAERRAELADLLAREADPDRREIYARLLDRADRDAEALADAKRDFGLALARARSGRFAKLGRPLDAATMAALLSRGDSVEPPERFGVRGASTFRRQAARGHAYASCGAFDHHFAKGSRVGSTRFHTSSLRL
jgi:hypothetical protein